MITFTKNVAYKYGVPMIIFIPSKRTVIYYVSSKGPIYKNTSSAYNQFVSDGGVNSAVLTGPYPITIDRWNHMDFIPLWRANVYPDD